LNTLEALYELLHKDKLELDSIELAESLWLSKYISKVEHTKSSDTLQVPTINDAPIEEEHEPIEAKNEAFENKSEILPTKKQARKDMPLHPMSSGDNKSSLPFRTPLVKGLFKDTELIYAFRHFRQKIVSLKQTKLDEEKIADHMAKTDIFRPFYKKSFEKRFSVLCIVDNSESMKIWESLIADFIKNVKSYHIFKEIKVQYLLTDEVEAELFAKKEKTSKLKKSWYKQFDHNNLCFVFTDMTSEAWRNGNVLEQIALWQKHFPLAIVQMLPQRLWNATKLLDASMGKMSHSKKFKLNKHISSRAEVVLLNEEESLGKFIKTSVLNVNTKAIDAYGGVMRCIQKNRINS